MRSGLHPTSCPRIHRPGRRRRDRIPAHQLRGLLGTKAGYPAAIWRYSPEQLALAKIRGLMSAIGYVTVNLGTVESARDARLFDVNYSCRALPHPNRDSTKVVASTKVLPNTRQAAIWAEASARWRIRNLWRRSGAATDSLPKRTLCKARQRGEERRRPGPNQRKYKGFNIASQTHRRR